MIGGSLASLDGDMMGLEGDKMGPVLPPLAVECELATLVTWAPDAITIYIGNSSSYNWPPAHNS